MIIRYKKSFEKDLKKIRDKRILGEIKELLSAIKNTREFSEIKNIKKLSGHETAYRIRMGNYRIGFFYENDIMVMTRILHRRDIYKRFP